MHVIDEMIKLNEVEGRVDKKNRRRSKEKNDLIKGRRLKIHGKMLHLILTKTTLPLNQHSRLPLAGHRPLAINQTPPLRVRLSQ